MSFETFSSGLLGVVGNDLFHAPLHVDGLPRLDLDVRGLALEPARDLVDEDLGVRQGHALSFRAARERSAPIDIAMPTQMVRDVRLDELHGVVDGQPA